jgi:adenosine deaminase
VNELEGELGEERERLKVERAKEKMALEAAAAKTKKLEERVNELERELAGKNELKPLLEESTALVEKLSGQLRESETELVASRQLVEKLYGQVQQWENRPAPKPAVKKPNLYNFEMRTLARYVAPAPSITELSDTEIGWFD